MVLYLFTGLTQSAIQPSAERYCIFFCISVFALVERKNRDTDTMESTMLPQAKNGLYRVQNLGYFVNPNHRIMLAIGLKWKLWLEHMHQRQPMFECGITLDSPA